MHLDGSCSAFGEYREWLETSNLSQKLRSTYILFKAEIDVLRFPEKAVNAFIQEILVLEVCKNNSQHFFYIAYCII